MNFRAAALLTSLLFLSHAGLAQEARQLDAWVLELKDAGTRAKATEKLLAADPGEAVAALLRALAARETKQVPKPWTDLLGQLAPKPKGLAAVRAALTQDKDARLRREACDVLVERVPSTSETAGALVAQYLVEKEAKNLGWYSWGLRVHAKRKVKLAPLIAPHLAGKQYGRTLQLIANLKGAGAPLVPALQKMLGHADPEVRAGAVWALGQLAGSTPVDLAGVVRRLADAEAAVRRKASFTLGQLGPLSRGALPALIKAAGDADPGVRENVAWALVRIARQRAALEEVVPVLVRLLTDKAVGVREYAAWGLGSKYARAHAGSAMAPLSRMLADPEAKVRKNAGTALWQIAGQAGNARRLTALEPALSKGVASKDATVRQLCLSMLNAIEPATDGSVGGIAAALADPLAKVRARAALFLGKKGTKASKALPALLRAAGDEEAAVRENAGWALPRVAEAGQREQVLNALLGLLTDPAAAVRRYAVAGLAQDGMRAGAVGALDQVVACLLRETDPKSRAAAAAVLGRLAREKAAAPKMTDLIARLHTAVETPKPSVQLSAIAGIGALGDKDVSAAAALARALADRQARVRLAAAEALVKHSERAAVAVPALIKLLASRDGKEVAAAAKALGWIYKPALKAIGPICDRLAEPWKEGEVRKELTVALRKLVETSNYAPPEADKVVRTLLALYRDKSPVLRRVALMTTGWVGPAAVPTIGPMTALLADEDVTVRRSAAAALGHLFNDTLHWRKKEVAERYGAELEKQLAAVTPALAALARSLAGDADWQVRYFAAEALFRLQPPRPAAVTALTKALGDAHPRVRGHAAAALGFIGKPALGAVPALEALQKREKDAHVLKYVGQALKALRKIE